jgi:hypothetical protein
VAILQSQQICANSGALDRSNSVRQRRALCEVNATLTGSWNCLRTAAFIAAMTTTATQARMKLRIDISRFSDRALCQLGIYHRIADNQARNRQSFAPPTRSGVVCIIWATVSAQTAREVAFERITVRDIQPKIRHRGDLT